MEKEGYMLTLNDKKKASNDKYLKQLEDIKIRVLKGYRKVIQDLAKEEQYNGVNPFIISLVNDVLKSKGREEIPTGMREKQEREEE